MRKKNWDLLAAVWLLVASILYILGVLFKTPEVSVIGALLGIGVFFIPNPERGDHGSDL